MKTIYNLKNLLLGTFAILTIMACEKEDYLIFTAKEPVEKVAFTNTMSEVYKITEQTKTSLIERLVWNTPDFDAPTTITYVVEGSDTADFSSIDWTSGDTSENQVGLTADAFVTYAEANALDFDPNTADTNGDPNNLFTMYFRVTAHAGDTAGGNSVTSVSEAVTMNIELVESAGACVAPVASNWGLVGDAINGWGGISRGFANSNDIELQQIGENLFQAVATVLSGDFKFRQDGGWAMNLGDNNGTLEKDGPNIPIQAGTYLITLDLNANSYTATAYDGALWGIVGSAVTLQKDDGSGDYAEWGGGAADTKFLPDPCNDGVFLLKGVALRDGDIKFRQDDGWAMNLGDNNGTLEKDGPNITVQAGTYDIKLDLNAMSYELTRL